MELNAPLPSGSTGGEINFDAAARVRHDAAVVDLVHRPGDARSGKALTHPAARLNGEEAFDEGQARSYSLMSTSSSRGPMTRSQSSHDEGYGCHQDLATSTVFGRPSSSPFPHATPVLNAHEELHDEEFDDNDDDGFAWDGSGYDVKARSSSTDTLKIGRYDHSLSPSGCASIVSANSRNGTSPSPRNLSMPVLPCCSMPSTPDSKLSAGLEEAISTFQSWEVVHNVSFSGRSSQHQRRTSAMSVSLHSIASRASGGRAEASNGPIDEFAPLPTNLLFFQPPSLISPDPGSTTDDSPQNTTASELDLLEEQEKELVQLAIERSKQDTVPKDRFEPSLRVALAESMQTQCAMRISPCHSSSLSFSFALSEPPPPVPSFNGMISLSEPLPPTPSVFARFPQTRPTQPGRLASSKFLSETLPPKPTSFSAEREMSTTRNNFPVTVSASSVHSSNVMGPEDFSTSEVEEQNMLRMALERSLHEPTSPRRPHSQTSPSPRYTSDCFACDTR